MPTRRRLRDFFVTDLLILCKLEFFFSGKLFGNSMELKMTAKQIRREIKIREANDLKNQGIFTPNYSNLDHLCEKIPFQVETVLTIPAMEITWPTAKQIREANALKNQGIFTPSAFDPLNVEEMAKNIATTEPNYDHLFEIHEKIKKENLDNLMEAFYELKEKKTKTLSSNTNWTMPSAMKIQLCEISEKIEIQDQTVEGSPIGKD
jgi:hypothetical protein